MGRSDVPAELVAEMLAALPSYGFHVDLDAVNLKGLAICSPGCQTSAVSRTAYSGRPR